MNGIYVKSSSLKADKVANELVWSHLETTRERPSMVLRVLERSNHQQRDSIRRKRLPSLIIIRQAECRSERNLGSTGPLCARITVVENSKIGRKEDFEQDGQKQGSHEVLWVRYLPCQQFAGSRFNLLLVKLAGRSSACVCSFAWIGARMK